MKHHPYAALFPTLDDDALQELADDIAKNGLRTPIIIDDDDQILDGRNRAAACLIAGVEPVYEPFVGDDEAKLALIVSCNLHRRHLTTSQRASVAARLLPIYEEQAAKRRERKPKSVVANLPPQNGKARDKAGAALGVSGRLVATAQKVHDNAVPEVVAAVDRGEMAVSRAAALADLDPERQREFVTRPGSSILRPAGGKTQSDIWATPQWLFDSLNVEFGFTLDPATDGTNAKCSRFFTELDNGLLQDWGAETVFLNPPYSDCEGWMSKAYTAAQHGATVVCLVPARTDTNWWHRYAMKGEIRFFRGRLKFGNAIDPAPFPSVVIVFRPAKFKLVGEQSNVPVAAAGRD